MNPGDVTSKDDTNFITSFNLRQHLAHQNSVRKGFWSEGQTDPGMKIALMHGELSEALEALRDGSPESVKIPGFLHLEEELADCVIRIMDFGGRNNLNIAEAIVAKMNHNADRPFMHGRKF